MKSKRFIVAVAAACVFVLSLQFAAAQTLYKSTMRDGRVLYGDQPAPGAAKVEEMHPDTSKKGIGDTAGREKEALKDMENARLQREGKQDKMQAAEQSLKDAEAARDGGKEPLEGERLGTVRGKSHDTSRLTDAYFERQRRLEAAVENARRELDGARSGQ